ncbi:MAG: rhamnulokinase [Pirellula sp.]|jgi:rhamnulokinase|nr:rhamnulokinase [Pirellula sp.]
MDLADIFLAIDLGASSGRVLAAELRGDQIQLHDVHRFENAPISIGRRLHWDLLQLWREIDKGLTLAAEQYPNRIASVGVDTWGVDFVLLDRNEDLVGPAFCYRDPRTRGKMERAFEKISRSEIFAETGIQFMEINTLYQLFSMREESSPLLDIAERFLMIPDFFHWLLTGKMVNEFTNASTTQMLQPGDAGWSTKILDRLDIPVKLFSEPVQPGTDLGPIRQSVRARTGLDERTRVVVPATHDTGAAVLAVPADGFKLARPTWCYISSGTWSLMGVELDHPVRDEKAQRYNFTNEGGAQGSVRLLKNIAGLWPFQQCRASWQRRGKPYDWTTLTTLAAEAKPLQHWLDLEHPMFVAPDDMLDAIFDYLQKSNQTIPESDGAVARAALESLALRYRVCLHALEDVLGYPLETIHVVGGGVKNHLLCQMTADACNRRVIAGPVEATALGNVISQLLGMKRFHSIEAVRAWMRQSSALEIYEPRDTRPWIAAAERLAQGQQRVQ